MKSRFLCLVLCIRLAYLAYLCFLRYLLVLLVKHSCSTSHLANLLLCCGLLELLVVIILNIGVRLKGSAKHLIIYQTLYMQYAGPSVNPNYFGIKKSSGTDDSNLLLQPQ